MGFKSGETQILTNGDVFFFHPKHHEGHHHDASIWRIPCSEEYRLCADAIEKKYTEHPDGRTQLGYNLKRVGSSFETLGTNQFSNHLIIAKYNENVDIRQWHGYPADYVRKNQDHPKDKTLMAMYDNGLISKSDMSKIKRGKII